MKKDRVFIYAFVALFVVYVIVDYMAPEPVQWNVTFRASDKNPFGGYILNERSDDLFTGGFELSYRTISELEDSGKNLLILTDHLNIGDTDLEKLFGMLEKGNHVLIGATSLSSKLSDTLGVVINYEFSALNQTIFESPQVVLIFDDSSKYVYPSSLVMNNFELEDEHGWKVLAGIEEGPVAITRELGQGKLTMISAPHLFTNFGLLINENYPAAARLLSNLPPDDVHYTMYYKSGRMEATTPFRYFLREDALRWSLYLGLFVIVLFLTISSWRKQRAIPVIVPPKNTTVEYVKTLGTLFFRERNHKNAAMKLIQHFIAQVRERYFVQVDFSERFYQQLASKSGVSLETVIRTFDLIQTIKSQPQIQENQLIDLSQKIEEFK